MNRSAFLRPALSWPRGAQNPSPRGGLLAGAVGAVCVLMACAGNATAQDDKSPSSLFTCRDASGRTLSSDRPILECANQPLRQLNNNGVTIREIPAPLSPEQLRRKAAADEARRVQQIEQRQNDARDRALLTAYTSVEALEAARRRSLAEIEDGIAISQRRMVATNVDLAAANAAVQSQTTPAGRDAATRNVRFIAQSILADDAAVQRMRAEMAEVNLRFDSDRERLRALLRDPEPVLQVQAGRPGG